MVATFVTYNFSLFSLSFTPKGFSLSYVFSIFDVSCFLFLEWGDGCVCGRTVHTLSHTQTLTPQKKTFLFPSKIFDFNHVSFLSSCFHTVNHGLVFNLIFFFLPLEIAFVSSTKRFEDFHREYPKGRTHGQSKWICICTHFTRDQFLLVNDPTQNEIRTTRYAIRG